MYLSYPSKRKGHKKNTETAILYLTDIFGIPLVNNKLYVTVKCFGDSCGLMTVYRLGDSFANAGYFVVMPDLFDGEPGVFRRLKCHMPLYLPSLQFL